MKRTLLLALAMLVLLVPSGAASDSSADWDELFQGAPGHMDIIVGPDAVRFSLEEITVTDEQAKALRHAIDAAPGVGDEDGTVSESEAKTFEAFVTASMNAMVPDSFDLDMVRMDGRAPHSEEEPVVHVERLEITGAEGDISSTDPIRADLAVLLRFETVDQTKTRHHLRLENVWGDLTGHDMDHAPDMEIRVQGYASWQIQEDSIRPAAVQDHYEDGVLVFTGDDVEAIEEEWDGLEFEIEGDPGDQILSEAEESPGLTPLVFLFVALGGLIGLRRRR